MARVKRRPQLFWPLMLMLVGVGVKSILIALTHVAAMPSRPARGRQMAVIAG